MSKEAMKLALEALDELLKSFEKDGKFVMSSSIRNELFDRLTEVSKQCQAIAEAEKQEQSEPVGEVESSLRFTGGFHVKLRHTATMPEVGTPLYTTPPHGEARGLSQQQRKPLTDEQLKNYYQNNEWLDGVRFAEQFHGIKENA